MRWLMQCRDMGGFAWMCVVLHKFNISKAQCGPATMASKTEGWEDIELSDRKAGICKTLPLVVESGKH